MACVEFRSDEKQLRERAEGREFSHRVLVQHGGSPSFNHEHTERNVVKRKKRGSGGRREEE